MSIIDIKNKFPLAIDTIRFPVRYDDYGQKIWDKNNDMVIDVRGWGHIKYMSEPKERQDQIGLMIVELINLLK